MPLRYEGLTEFYMNVNHCQLNSSVIRWRWNDLWSAMFRVVLIFSWSSNLLLCEILKIFQVIEIMYTTVLVVYAVWLYCQSRKVIQWWSDVILSAAFLWHCIANVNFCSMEIVLIRWLFSMVSWVSHDISLIDLTLHIGVCALFVGLIQRCHGSVDV